MIRDIINFLRWGVVSTSPNPKLEEHPLSAVRDYLLHSQLSSTSAGRSSISNLRTRHAVVTSPLNKLHSNCPWKWKLHFDTQGTDHYAVTWRHIAKEWHPEPHKCEHLETCMQQIYLREGRRKISCKLSDVLFRIPMLRKDVLSNRPSHLPPADTFTPLFY
jgi:hypothetical protein